MPVINTGVIKEVISVLSNDNTIKAFVAKDVNNKYAVRPGNFNPVGAIFPCINVIWKQGKSDSIFPNENGTLNIYAYVDKDFKEPYAALDVIKDYIILLFNRKGSWLNKIDITTNTGIRFNQFVKQSAECDYDEDIKKYYAEVIFDVNKSEDESFLPSDSGDLPWQ